MITCTRRIQFCAGHRVWGHENKCAHPHGHNYVVFVTAQADKLDPVGRVVDFSVLKEKVGGWIDREWDHGFLFSPLDMELSALYTGPFEGYKHFCLPYNPTAENMARYLLHEVCPQVLQDTGVTAVRVVVWETENCYAEASLNG